MKILHCNFAPMKNKVVRFNTGKITGIWFMPPLNFFATFLLIILFFLQQLISVAGSFNIYAPLSKTTKPAVEKAISDGTCNLRLSTSLPISYPADSIALFTVNPEVEDTDDSSVTNFCDLSDNGQISHQPSKNKHAAVRILFLKHSLVPLFILHHSWKDFLS